MKKCLVCFALVAVLVLRLAPLTPKAAFQVDLETVNTPLLNEQGVIENNGSLTCPACGAENVTWVELSTVAKSTMSAGSYHCYVDPDKAADVPAKMGLTTGAYTLCLHTDKPGTRIRTQIVVRKNNTLNLIGNGEVQKTAGQTILNNVGGATVNIYGGKVYGGGYSKNEEITWINAKGPAISMHSDAAGTKTRSTLLITGTAIINNGYTTADGGLIYLDGVDATIAGAKLQDGHGAKGNDLFALDSTVNITGCLIKTADAEQSAAGNVYIENTVLQLTDTAVEFGGVTVGNGATLRLAGETVADDAGPIELTGDGKVQLLAGWSGSATLSDGVQTGAKWGAALTQVQAGAVTAGVFTPGDAAYTGKLHYSNVSGSPDVVLTEKADAAGTVAVGSVQYRNLSDGQIDKWADGLQDYDAAKYYVRFTNQTGEMTLTKDLIVDVNGKTNLPVFTSVEEVSLSLLDAANNDYDGVGKVKTAGSVTLRRDVTAAGKRYITLDNDDGTVSAHRVGMTLESVALSTAHTGYYYQARYEFDDAVKGAIHTYGIAASVVDMPGSDFDGADKDDNAWTTETKALVSGGLVNGHGIVNILKTGVDNAARLDAKIYANPYLKLNLNGQTVTMVADTENAGTDGGVHLSLLDVLTLVDDCWLKLNTAAHTQLYDFYDTWESALSPHAKKIPFTAQIMEKRTAQPLNVMTLNMAGYSLTEDQYPLTEGPEGATCDLTLATRMPKFLEMLSGEQVDIVGLQEINGDIRSWLQTELPESYSVIVQSAFPESDTARYNSNTAVGIVYNNEKLTTHDNRGIQDLLELVASQPERLKGAIVADKIIGKAAASLMTSCGVVEVHTNVICTPAREMFERAGIKIFAGKEVPLILNREKSGMCPMDTRLEGIDGVEECVEILQNIPRVL